MKNSKNTKKNLKLLKNNFISLNFFEKYLTIKKFFIIIIIYKIKQKGNNMRNLELHQTINEKNERLFLRKSRMQRMVEESKFFDQLQRQERLLKNGQSMSKTHMNMLRKFKEMDTSNLSLVDKKVLKNLIEVMDKRLENEESLLLSKLENFKNLKEGMGL